MGKLIATTQATLDGVDPVGEWVMGLAHMLGEESACPELVDAGPRRPLLEPDQAVLFGWDEGQSQAHERVAIERLGLSVIPAGEVAADPQAASTRALGLLDWADALLIHFDVDVIDFTDTPLSENWGRNEGIS